MPLEDIYAALGGLSGTGPGARHFSIFDGFGFRPEDFRAQDRFLW